MYQFLPARHNCSDCAHCPREIIQIGTYMFLFLSEMSLTRAGKKLKDVLNDCVNVPFKLCMQKQMKGLKLTAVSAKGDCLFHFNCTKLFELMWKKMHKLVFAIHIIIRL